MVAANPETHGRIPNPPPDTAPIPELDDREILAAFLDPSQNLFDLCDEFNLSIDELHAWLAQPHIAAALAKLLEMHALRNRVLAAQSSAAALETIAAIARGQPPQGLGAETARKAAAQILRLAAPPKPPRASRRALRNDADSIADDTAHEAAINQPEVPFGAHAVEPAADNTGAFTQHPRIQAIASPTNPPPESPPLRAAS